MELITLPVVWLDLIWVFTLLEWLVLALRRRVSGRGLDIPSLTLGLLPGLLLMLALRLAASDTVPAGAFLCCAAAGLFHGWDFARRSRSADAALALPAAAG